MKLLITVSRVIIGLVFIFSGVVKAIDPLGSAYKFHDYFQAFNLGFLVWLSLPLAILLCTAEFIAGFSVLSGVRIKTGIWIVLLLMIIFTPLTLVLALTNPVSDCGCFGDAIHLTNWQTFGKNVILIALSIILFTGIKKFRTHFSKTVEWTIIGAVIILFILFSLANLRYLPIIDFFPYKTGVKIADKMVIPEGVAVDEYETTFIYEKDGVQKEFSLADYPADDTTWKFIDQKSVLVKRVISLRYMISLLLPAMDIDITENILTDPGYSLLMITSKLAEAGDKNLAEGFDSGILLHGKRD